MKLVRPTTIIWLVLYLAAMTALVLGMLRLRANTIAAFNTPEQQQSWEDWRDATTQPQGGVDRREPTSSEPPALVLMRDYFPMCMAASLLFGTTMWVMCAVLIAGALRPAKQHSHDTHTTS